MNNLVKNSGKNLQIQFLRAFFCLLIVFFHFTIQYNKYYDCSNVFVNAFVDCLDDAGILAFFILSGFYLVRRKEMPTFKEKMIYWLKRFLNMYVLYVIAITIIFLASQFGYLGDRKVSLPVFFQNIAFINVLTHSKSVDGAHWYILALFCLYIIELVRDLLPFNKEKYSHYYWFLILLISVLSFVIQENIDKNSTVLSIVFRILNVFFCQGYFVYAFIGISIYMLDYDRPRCFKNIIIITFAALSFAFAAFTDWKRILILLIVVPIIMLALFRKLEFLEKIKPLVFLGNASYSIYLLHQNIGFMLLNAFVPFAGYYLSLFIVIVIVLAIGMAFYLLVEMNTKKLISLLFKTPLKENSIDEAKQS